MRRLNAIYIDRIKLSKRQNNCHCLNKNIEFYLIEFIKFYAV